MSKEPDADRLYELMQQRGKFEEADIEIMVDQIEVLPLSATSTGKWDISWNNAPFALVIHEHETGRCCPDGCAVWGLSRDMPWQEAWLEFDLAGQYEIIIPLG